MSIKSMDEILSRMILDQEFRDLLRRDPKWALAGYELTPEEQNALAKLKKRPSPKMTNRFDPSATGTGHSFSLN